VAVMRAPLHKPAGFSLVELLVCMAIILVAYVTVFSAGSEQGQARRKAACAANLEQMQIALSVYAAEHEKAFPVTPGATSSEVPLSELVPRYTSDTSIFVCPGSNTATLPGAQPFANRRISYAYYMGVTRDADASVPLVSDAQVNTNAKRRGEPLFSLDGKGPGHNHRKYGGSVLFADGHVETWGPLTARDLPLTTGAVLLNPKP
jgi:prepilin-type N-terminal cleavage/methylation domain-containing protein/prepilin-type processing-associated H-X9-DG protein